MLLDPINNQFYDDLQHEWYTASNHPVALLRAENRLRNPWIASHLTPNSSVLDMGCGAGFLSNSLALAGHTVTGVDVSGASLAVAKSRDTTGSVRYLLADATALPLPDASFDAVCAMDVLEHVENPAGLIDEARRLLKPGGLFFFHTFNRTWLSFLIVVKGVEWCVKNTPPRMHVYRLFIKPEELEKMCHGFTTLQMKGVNIKLSRPFWKMLFTRRVPEDVEFTFTNSLKVGYSGFTKKE
jgi:2-polyprenyl-6-hydroxyphenyl methylase / 3-demethylubiquinone-9 3-methyltransferase